MPLIGNTLVLNIGNAYTCAIMEAIAQAITNFGSQEAMAAELGVSQPTVSEWLRQVRPVPARRCVQIEQHKRNQQAALPVHRWDLRPSDWWVYWPELVGAPGAPKVPRDLKKAA